MWIGPASIRVGTDAAQIAGVLCRHGLGHGPVGVLGPGIAKPGTRVRNHETPGAWERRAARWLV